MWRRGGPQALVTGKAVFAWQKERRRFRLESVHPGCDLDEVRASTGFEFECPAEVPATIGPTSEEITMLRGPVRREIALNYPEFARRVWARQTEAA